jgi:dihydrofolate reductase
VTVHSHGASSAPSGPQVVLVAAIALNGVIGKKGALPWRLKSDLQHFRQLTMGKPVIMGRKTYVSIGKPLSGRTNIVVSRDRDFGAAGILVAPSVDAALAAARGDALRRGVREIAVIGGAEIYQQTMAKADRLVITRVQLQPEGDTGFPPVDDTIWEEVSCTQHSVGPEDEASSAVHLYERRKVRTGGQNQPVKAALPHPGAL